MTQPAPPALTLRVTLLLSALHTAWVLLGAPPATTRDLIGNLAFFSSYALATILSARAARHLSGRFNRAWTFITAAMTCWTAGQLTYTIIDARYATVPYPSPAEIGFVLFPPLFLAGIGYMFNAPAGRVQTATFALDVAIVLLTLASVPVIGLNVNTLLHDHPIVVAQHISNLLLLTTMMVFALRQPHNPARAYTGWLTLALLLFGTAHILYGNLVTRGLYAVGSPLDPLWVWAAALIGLAAHRSVMPATARRATHTGGRWATIAPVVLRLLPYLAITVTFIRAFAGARATGPDTLTLITALLVVARLSLTEYQNAHLQRQLQRQAYLDALTGLPNRAALQRDLPNLIESAAMTGVPLAVLFIDLDRFKPINDLFGHATGDVVLREACARVQRHLRPNDLIARVGGDELVVVLCDLNADAPGATAEHAAARLLDHLAQPFRVDGRQLTLSASIGIAHVPADTTDASTALSYADLAMYQAKQAGRNTHRTFQHDWHHQSSAQFELDAQLQGAAARGEFELHYQPLVDARTGTLRSFEALLRWHNPTLGAVSPAQFIPVAETRGLIVPIGEWVLRAACRQLRAWHAAGYTHARVSVNVSALQFALPDFVRSVEATLRTHGVPGHALAVELTESTLIQDLEASNAKLAALHALGVRTALDDFGTGYSSLSYLQRLHVNTLKIDRSFMQAIDGRGGALVRAITHLAHDLDLRVVVEGVETAQQLRTVQALGGDTVQGYHVSRPLPVAQAEAFLRAARPALEPWPDP
ncbi:putative bifunctional diguanylate cyclase/phosphodiesterase [Deinococcus maricopensis]|uniref:Diguanylate cyclase/phosphodiesterase n=1 Tax=Deinococcus maricopensis (strain DSM 21211 / LMG 22137 / NRRL B-23946 / LB-34) TaxID=709986 RepID=E8U3L4_DEIML|nr:bifunctional diguanylate cyclase/phosphodiesterase [Deinococcus maricopensis]ADV68638.1 diguanylate cyclase/phosphodiesterase [Deinococcus maricopensis DSM 21211]